MSVAIGLLGMLLLLCFAYLLSSNKKRINYRLVFSALLLQVAIGFFILFVPFGVTTLGKLAYYVTTLLNYGQTGIQFLFGPLIDPNNSLGFIFAFNVLPLIVFFASFIAVLYYLGIIQIIIKLIGGVLEKILGSSKTESMSAVANIFVGQTEAPLVIKPYMPKLTDSEFFAVMVGGLASISGTVLAGYAAMGVPMPYLLAASFMAAPGGLLFAKILLPETEIPSYDLTQQINYTEKSSANIIEAAAIGATSGLQLALSVGAMLLAVTGLVALLNGILGGVGDWFNLTLSLQTILGWIFAPIAFLMGVPWQDATITGALLGQKIILNEFIAYASFSQYLHEATAVTILTEKTKVIISFALCGFANISSIAVLMGGLTIMAPNRRSFIATNGIKAVMAGTCSNLTSACIAGIFYQLAL